MWREEKIGAYSYPEKRIAIGDVVYTPEVYPQVSGWATDKTDYQRILQENIRLRGENEKLVEIFQFAVREFEAKNKKIAFLEERVKEAEVKIKELSAENKSLKERVQEVEGRNKLLNKMVFGDKSEKKGDCDVTVTTRKRGAVEGHNGHGRKVPDALPQIEEIVDLPEDKKLCSICGQPYQETNSAEESYEVCVKKMYYLKKIKRKVYRKTCRCGAPFVTAKVPAKLIPRGKFSTEFWVDVLINKYRSHIPIERQVAEMGEYGLGISNGTIFGGLKKIHTLYLKSLYTALGTQLRKAAHCHADESGWHLFAKADGKANYNWFIWIFISKEVALFVLDPSRSSRVPYKALFDIDVDEVKAIDKTLLNARAIKQINVDKFSAYKSLQRMGLVQLAFCWAHQRREFIEAKTKYPQLSGWADEWVERIATLYPVR